MSDPDSMNWPKMYPAELERVKGAVSKQGQCLGNHEQVLNSLVESVNQITNRLAELSIAAPSVSPSPLASAPESGVSHEPHVPAPSKYSGDPDSCRSFFTQIKLVFRAQPSRYQTETAKIAYLTTLLDGPPLSYFNALYEQDSPAVQSFEELESELKRVYDHPVRSQQAGMFLMRLRQGRRSVRDYVCEFRSLAVESGWNDQALITAFLSEP